MLNPDCADVNRHWGRLVDQGAEYWQRMLLLTTSGLFSMEGRFLRLGTECGNRLIQELLELQAPRTPAQISDARLQWLADCNYACSEELRNTEQIAQLTQEEMHYWNRRWVDQWFRLAASCLPGPRGRNREPEGA